MLWAVSIVTYDCGGGRLGDVQTLDLAGAKAPPQMLSPGLALLQSFLQNRQVTMCSAVCQLHLRELLSRTGGEKGMGSGSQTQEGISHRVSLVYSFLSFPSSYLPSYF
jgi:hypothetical protein